MAEGGVLAIVAGHQAFVAPPTGDDVLQIVAGHQAFDSVPASGEVLTIVGGHQALAVYKRYVVEVLADNPSAYYRMGDASDPTVIAMIGNNLTAINTPTFGAAGLLTGDADTAITFTRASLEYLQGSDSGLPSGNNPFTMETWIKTSTSAECGLILWGTNATAVGFGVLSGRPCINDANYFNPFGSTNTINDNVRHLLALTWDGTTFKAWRDGVQQGSSWVPGVDNNITLGTPNRLVIGTRNSNSFDGTMDEVAIYPTALSGARLLAHYNAGIAA